MKLRITGTPAECRTIIRILTGNAVMSVTIGDVSRPYPNRASDGGGVRVYVNLALPPQPVYHDTNCCAECGVYSDEPHGPECRWRSQCCCRYCRGGAQ